METDDIVKQRGITKVFVFTVKHPTFPIKMRNFAQSEASTTTKGLFGSWFADFLLHSLTYYLVFHSFPQML